MGPPRSGDSLAPKGFGGSRMKPCRRLGFDESIDASNACSDPLTLDPAGDGAESDEDIEVFGAEGVHHQAGDDGMPVADICRKAGDQSGDLISTDARSTRVCCLMRYGGCGLLRKRTAG